MVAKVEWHPGELFARLGFIVTNLSRSDEAVVKIRQLAEQWIKEGQKAVKWTRLWCHDSVDNQVRRQRLALAYNWGDFPSPADATPQRQTLVADDLEGEAGEDWGQGGGPGTVCQVSDGRGGYPPRLFRTILGRI